MRHINLQKLDMGLVEANFVCISKKDKPLWIQRGFEEHREYPLFLVDLEEDETIMLGVPRNIVEFGQEHLIHSEILEISTQLGTYGMGGPGFFGLLCKTEQGNFWVTITVWASAQYALLDQRIVECHPSYDDEYDPWIKDQDEELEQILRHAVITSIHLDDSQCKILLKYKDNTEHELVIYKNNEKLPRMGNGEPRKDAFESGVMADYLLVTYEDTGLHV